MVVFPNCKINLGLNILRKRSDGYHDLETIFYPLYSFTDALEIIENKNDQFPPFSSSGLPVPGKPVSNLCVQAYRILKKDFPSLPPVHIHLHKVIPSGAGLGGGSSDASFTIRLLNDLFQLSLSKEKMMEYAGGLGSDCPFFILNTPCFAKGRGEILEKINLDLSSYKFLIVNPGIHINTGRAFMNIRPNIPDKSIKEVITAPVERWKDQLYNDFEQPVFSEYREIVEIKDQLYHHGAVYASMTGSGSTVFGIFKKEQSLSLTFPSHYFYRELKSQ